jgi:hypothetical protein
LIDGIEWEGLEVVLLGGNITGSFAGSGGIEGGLAIAPEGVYLYGSFEYGTESDINLLLTGSLTIFPTMDRADYLRGAGSSVGFAAGEGIVGSTSGVISGRHLGTNYQVGVGVKTLFPGSVSIKESQTGLIALSKGAKSHVQEGILKGALWDAKRHINENIYKPLGERKNALLSTVESFQSDISKFENQAKVAKSTLEKRVLKGKAFDTREALINTYNSLSDTNKLLEDTRKTMNLIDKHIQNLE